jgi:hypothetical protein
MTRPFNCPGCRERDGALEQLAYEMQELGEAFPDDEETGNRLVVDRLDQVEKRSIEWLWPDFLPLGKLWLLDGRPGTGKSHLTLAIAAAVTTGQPLPGGSRMEPADVVFVCEDDPADTIRPRAEAAGANLSRLHFVRGVGDGDDIRLPQLPGDVRRIQALVIQHAARLVIIDPLNAYLGTGIDSHKDQDIRRALLPVVRLAEETGALVLAVRHLSKQHGGHAVYAGLGSVGIVGTARGALLLAPDPNDDTRRVLAVSKTNLSRPGSSLVFSIVENSKGSHIEWHGESTLTADDLVRDPSSSGEPGALDEAIDWLLDALADGPKPKRELLRLAKAAGITEQTLERAKQKAGVQHRREDFGGSYLWFLPTDTPPTPGGRRSPMFDNEPRENRSAATIAPANVAKRTSPGETGELEGLGELDESPSLQLDDRRLGPSASREVA